MMSERGEPITIINGVTLKKSDIPKKINYNYDQDDFYEDPFKEVKEERNRIRNFKSKPCPSDFPEQLKPYWKDHLEFSFTPYQSGWLYLQQKQQNKFNTRK